jgi:hypothetical protein
VLRRRMQPRGWALMALGAATAAPTATHFRPSKYSLIDAAVDDGAGGCRIFMTAPPRCSHAVLHMQLQGHGTRGLAAQALSILGNGFQQCSRSAPIVCVVDMRQADGASVRASTRPPCRRTHAARPAGSAPDTVERSTQVLALGPISRFMIRHGRRLDCVIILEAHGLALAAVRTVQRLSRLPLACYGTRREFEAMCRASSEPHHKHALSVASSTRRRDAGRANWDGFVGELRNSWARLSAGAGDSVGRGVPNWRAGVSHSRARKGFRPAQSA